MLHDQLEERDIEAGNGLGEGNDGRLLILHFVYQNSQMQAVIFAVIVALLVALPARAEQEGLISLSDFPCTALIILFSFVRQRAVLFWTEISGITSFPNASL